MAVSEANGKWGVPEQIPGLGSGSGTQMALSCAGVGDCVAAAGSWPQQALVASQVHGSWTSARPVPGLAAMSRGGVAAITALSCGAAGWCAAAGYYLRPRQSMPGSPFVTTEHDGRWGIAQPVPGLNALNKAGSTARISAISCDPEGNCAAGGYYRARASAGLRPIVVSERAGAWGPVTLIAGADVAGSATITAISCTAPGDCTAAGSSSNPTNTWPFAVTEANGTWGTAASLPGIALGPTFDQASITGLSCAAPGQCAAVGIYGSTANAGGEYLGDYSTTAPFVASQVDGKWRAAREVAGLGKPAYGHLPSIVSVSCGTPGDCAAGGYGATGSPPNDIHHAFVVTETDGTWGTAVQVTGLATLHSIGSEVAAVACGPGTTCLAAGGYETHSGPVFRNHVFVTVDSR